MCKEHHVLDQSQLKRFDLVHSSSTRTKTATDHRLWLETEDDLAFSKADASRNDRRCRRRRDELLFTTPRVAPNRLELDKKTMGRLVPTAKRVSTDQPILFGGKRLAVESSFFFGTKGLFHARRRPQWDIDDEWDGTKSSLRSFFRYGSGTLGGRWHRPSVYRQHQREETAETKRPLP